MKVGIIGGLGNMGKALERLLRANGVAPKVSDRGTETTNREILKESDIVFICVKPKDFSSVGEQIGTVERKTNSLLVSCAAFVPFSKIQTRENTPVVRFMSGLSIADGRGCITLVGNGFVGTHHLETVSNLCKGPKILKVESEDLIDVATIMSGCMPAFTSYFLSPYINFGIGKGLSKEDATTLCLSSVNGALSLLERETPEEIIKRVATPGGVTVRGLETLEKGRVQEGIADSLTECFSLLNKRKD